MTNVSRCGSSRKYLIAPKDDHRFENTLESLRDCYEYWGELDTQDEPDGVELAAREKLLDLCYHIVNSFMDEV